MAAGLCGAAMTSSFAAKNPTLLAVAAARRRGRAPPLAGRALPFSPLTTASRAAPRRRGLGMTVTCFVPQDTEARPAKTTVVPAAASVLVPVPDTTTTALEEEARPAAVRRVAEMTARKRSERRTYLVAAVMSSLGVTSMAVAAVYYRFSWQMKEVPVTEMLGTFALSVGAAVGMEFWARWAHRALWHASLWHMHESHHRPREGPFELNDVFAIINAVPAIALLAYGFFHRGLVPGLCFGAGVGITMLGMAYIFVHDGLVHRRFPVGPIADVPYFRRVAAAHKIHHMDRFDGVPYGFFLGPRELEVVGGLDELEKELARISREAGQEAQGLGITLFGMAYMFVHDGLVHRRFPGPRRPHRRRALLPASRCRSQGRYSDGDHLHFQLLAACSVGWWLMAGAGLFGEKSTAGWLRLVAGGWFVLREKYCWLVADKPNEQDLDELGLSLSTVHRLLLDGNIFYRPDRADDIFNRCPFARACGCARRRRREQIHHMDKFEGVPYGLFLGPKELEEVGGLGELQKELARISRAM